MEIILPTNPKMKLQLTKLNTHEAWEVSVESLDYMNDMTRDIADKEISQSDGVVATDLKNSIDCGTF